MSKALFIIGIVIGVLVILMIVARMISAGIAEQRQQTYVNQVCATATQDGGLFNHYMCQNAQR